MQGYAGRLDECYKKALADGDINQAVEIADRLKGVVPVDVPDERIQKFVEALDDMLNCTPGPNDEVAPYCFRYGGQEFEVKII